MKKESKKTFQSIEEDEKSFKTTVASEGCISSMNITANSITIKSNKIIF